jgi:CBS domain-containing protein
VRAKDIMTATPLYSLPPSSTILDAAKLMAEKNVGSILVISEGKLFGIFTERDLAKLVAAGKPLDTKLEEVVTRDVVTVKPEDPLVKVVALMVDHNIRHVPVVDDEGKPVGIVSVRDVIREIL